MLFQAKAVQLDKRAKNSVKKEKFIKINEFKAAETESESKTAEKKETAKSVKAGGEKDKKQDRVKKSAQKEKRQVAGSSYQCDEVWTDEFSFGYVQVGSQCNSDEDLCLAFFHVSRNFCKGSYLIRHYCDPKQASLYSTEQIKCENSCKFSGLSGVCVK